MPKVDQDTGIQVDGMPQVQGYLGGGSQALCPQEQVKQCRKITLRQAAANAPIAPVL